MSSKMMYDIFPYSTLPSNEGAIREIVNKYPNKEALPVPIDNTTYVGIEVEVEGIGQLNGLSNVLWRVVEDGSLRNHGREFVSPPIRGMAIPVALAHLKEFLTTKNKSHDFSERTSVHVHMNARDMTVEQVFSFILTYLVFERILYKAVFDLGKRDREKNIFCLPIAEAESFLDLGTALEYFTGGREDLAVSYVTSVWRKYTGFNLVPLVSQGTIEFRHMAGNLDVEKLMSWINLILCIRHFATQYSFTFIKNKILALNTNSMYEHFLRGVFSQFSPFLLHFDIKGELEQGVITVKKALTVSHPVKGSHRDLAQKFLTSSLRPVLESAGYTFNSTATEENRKKLKADKKKHEEESLVLAEKISIVGAKRETLRIERRDLEAKFQRARSQAKQNELAAKITEIRAQGIELQNEQRNLEEQQLDLIKKIDNIKRILGGKPTAKKLNWEDEAFSALTEAGLGTIIVDDGMPRTTPPITNDALLAARQRMEQRLANPLTENHQEVARNVPRDPRRDLRTPWNPRRGTR